jgi:hypothetical protein
MTQKILVALGITTITIMLLAWGYLLLFGTPGGVNDVFTDLGLRNGATPIPVQTDLSPTTNLAPATTKLVQLSTKAVIGFTYIEAIEASTSTEAKPARLRYTERGTGHVYEIDFSSNTETRVSGTTIAKAVSSTFNETGEVAVTVAEDTDGTSATLQVFGAISNESTPLPDNADNFHFITADKLRYTVVENNETVAYELDWPKGTTASLWRVPLTDINVEWTDRGALIINRPAPWLKSGVYSVENGTLSRVIASEYAFSAKTEPSGRFIIYSHFDNELGLSINQTLDRESGTTATSALAVIPEKCTFVSSSFWCASSFETTSTNRDVLNDWYRGELTASDILWQGRVDGSAVYIDDLSGLAGFDIDVTYLTATEDNRLFFINKTNNTLWVYKIDQE